MRGKKAKALRAMVGYNPNEQRTSTPGTLPVGQTVAVAKEHPRHAYHFVKERYGILPVGQMLSRLKAPPLTLKETEDAKD